MRNSIYFGLFSYIEIQMINTKRKHHMNLDKVGPKKQAYLDRQASWSWFGVVGRTR